MVSPSAVIRIDVIVESYRRIERVDVIVAEHGAGGAGRRRAAHQMRKSAKVAAERRAQGSGAAQHVPSW